MRPESSPPAFPFTAVVGQEDLKLALLVNALDPTIGGVLVRGEKGSAKSTTARGLAALLPGGAPFVELPLGATEDRLLGTIDLKAALTSGERRFHPGLLHEANGGILYVDEVNLLPDHLVDLLLDVAASGVNRVEREGLSHTHPSRFVLVGSMNPEEGDLRPQLLDRFGLAVEVRASTDPEVRAEVVRRRLAFDGDPDGFSAEWSQKEGEVRSRLEELAFSDGPRDLGAEVPAELLVRVSRLCASLGAEGLRGDLVICRAALALARWEDRGSPTVEDVRRVAAMALAHRRRRGPFDETGVEPAEIDAALEPPDEEGPTTGTGSPDQDGPTTGTGHPNEDGPAISTGPPDEEGPEIRTAGHEEVEASRASSPGSGQERVEPSRGRPVAPGRHGVVTGERGRLVGDGPFGESSKSVAVAATAAAAVTRRGLARRRQGVATLTGGAGDETRREPARLVEEPDLREAVREQRRANLVVLVVDASASMGAPERMEAAKGAAISLLLDTYQRRDRVAMVTFSGDDAKVVLRPTGSIEVARARLQALPTRGRTPLAAGLRTGLSVVEGARSGPYRPLLVLVSDGRATGGGGGEDPYAASISAAAVVRNRKVASVVVDAEEGPGRLSLAEQLAATMGARYVRLAELSDKALASVVADELASGG